MTKKIMTTPSKNFVTDFICVISVLRSPRPKIEIGADAVDIHRSVIFLTRPARIEEIFKTIYRQSRYRRSDLNHSLKFM